MHENVEPAELLDRAVHDLLGRIVRSDVDGHEIELDRSREFLLQRLQLVGTTSGAEHLDALRAERPHAGLTDAASSARDDGYLALHSFVLLISWPSPVRTSKCLFGPRRSVGALVARALGDVVGGHVAEGHGRADGGAGTRVGIAEGRRVRVPVHRSADRPWCRGRHC